MNIRFIVVISKIKGRCLGISVFGPTEGCRITGTRYYHFIVLVILELSVEHRDGQEILEISLVLNIQQIKSAARRFDVAGGAIGHGHFSDTHSGYDLVKDIVDRRLQCRDVACIVVVRSFVMIAEVEVRFIRPVIASVVIGIHYAMCDVIVVGLLPM